MLFPNQSPEVTEGLGERALRRDVGVLTTVAINVVGIDVVAAWDTWRGEREGERGEGERGKEREVGGGRDTFVMSLWFSHFCV